MVRAIVHSTKHYKQDSLFSVASGAVVNKTLIQSVAVVDKNAVNEVEEGCSIKAVYIEYWLTGDDAVQGSFIATLEKVVGDVPDLIAAGQIAALASYTNKKNVFNVIQGLSPPNTQYPMAAFKGWYKIPKSKQRFGLGDKLVLSFFGQSDGLQVCGFTTYKEYN